MSELIERIAIAINPLVRIVDVDFPHGLEWDGEDETDSLTPDERDECRAIAAAVVAELDAAGYAIVPKEPTEEMIEALYGRYLSYAAHETRLASYRGAIAAAPRVTE